MQEEPKYLTVTEAARILRVDPRTVRRMAADGRIPGAVKMTKVWRIPAAWVRPPEPSQ